ncbi:hypothetical protein FGU46_10385 [Methanobacterium sp. CWC-01]|uniref:hypothetical protein n=1 Tax=Methanobacterium aridiramus TaxID=2584467 RepID=UPI002574953A|nr:hypothetical protein [Methanobacterium sp. CWC-01]WJI10467.1 hypothetical protein FGU46_10385 [Methanobacterium sp. CWC-01]
MKIEQVWHHIEDQLKPSNCQIVRQVMDIYTDKYYLGIDFYTNIDEDKQEHERNEGDIFGLQVKGRNLNRYLAFINQEEKLYVNLGNLDDWPTQIPINGPFNLQKHVRLEIKYGESNPNFKFKFNGYIGYFKINWPIRPEFSITVPLGMRMSDKGKNFHLDFYRIYSSNLREKWEKLRIEDPDIVRKNGKNVYTFAINEEDYREIILETPNTVEMLFKGSYHVSHDKKYWGLPAFGLVLVIFSLVELYKSIFEFKIDLITGLYVQSFTTPDLGILIALFSFSFLIISLHKENYEIPFVNFVNFSILFTWLIIGTILVVLLSKINLTNILISFVLILTLLSLVIISLLWEK